MDDIKQLPIPFVTEPQEPIDLQKLFLEAIERSEKKLHITIKCKNCFSMCKTKFYLFLTNLYLYMNPPKHCD